ncbi:MAG: DUF4411 family protein [Acidobacteria bacterium]|nr:DUF4411 family protein [Acidobacteriota bacterium]
MKYSIDTSAILDGWVRYYPPDTFPGLWDQIDKLISNRQLIATEEVLIELEKKEDTAYNWFRQRSNMFIPIDEQIQEIVGDILLKYERLVDTSKGRSMCDPFVIALAKLQNCPVVTAEKITGNLNKPKIPDVCLDLNIEPISLLDLIRRNRWIFR